MLNEHLQIRCNIDPNCSDWSKHRPEMSDGSPYDPRLAAWDVRHGHMTQQELNEYVAEGMKKIMEAHK